MLNLIKERKTFDKTHKKVFIPKLQTLHVETS